MSTKIEWTDETWNPLVGCEYLSEGCRGCYAARDAAGRLSASPIYAGLATREEGQLPRFTGEIRFLPERLAQPLHWTRPRRVFVNSMSDLFHIDVPIGYIAKVFATMAVAERHSFQVLTKRPQRMARVLTSPGFPGLLAAALQDLGADPAAHPLPLPNVWLGTSIEADRYAFRADHVRRIDAAVRWLSLEPLLGPLPSLNLDGIGWVVVGGESGPRARPMHPSWVRDLRDECEREGVPFVFKQWGEWAPTDLFPRDVVRTGDTPEDGALIVQPKGRKRLAVVEPEWACGLSHQGNVVMERLGKRNAGRELDGRSWDEYPAA